MNQVDQQALEVNRTRINLNDCIKQYISALDDVSLNRLHFKLSERVLTRSDSYILKIIFTNLIENALKYSPAESIIYVSMQVTDSPDNTISIQISNQLVQSNIPDLSLIFDRYYRSPLVKNISGTGLGLHLSQLLSIRLGGQLSAAIHEGTITFNLSLPHGEPT
jgi:signal transduction histidine kinase